MAITPYIHTVGDREVAVVTGGTRGIGYGLAAELTAQGCSVMIAGRSEDGVRQAVASLGRHGNVEGERCDVTSTTELQALWDSAHSRWGQIDHWINNAGMATAGIHLDELAPEQIEAVVATNLIGALLGAHVAIAGMRSQGHGQLLFKWRDSAVITW